jgi:hypothetical protein
MISFIVDLEVLSSETWRSTCTNPNTTFQYFPPPCKRVPSRSDSVEYSLEKRQREERNHPQAPKLIHLAINIMSILPHSLNSRRKQLPTNSHRKHSKFPIPIKPKRHIPTTPSLARSSHSPFSEKNSQAPKRHHNINRPQPPRPPQLGNHRLPPPRLIPHLIPKLLRLNRRQQHAPTNQKRPPHRLATDFHIAK